MTMHDRIPERTATAAELAEETVRIERALAGRMLPRTLHALIQQGAAMVPCGVCWQDRGRACDGRNGYHLARFERAHRRGLITRAELVGVVDGLDVIAERALVLDVTP